MAATTSSTVLQPAPLAPGDRIVVVAPSSPFPRGELLSGLAWLRERYDVRMASNAFSRSGYLAGDDARRAREMAAALESADVKAIVAARGGYGAMRIVDHLPWPALRAHPKWIVGFSDVTVLHLAALGAGVASIHAPNVTGLWRAPPADRAAWMRALEAPQESAAFRGLQALRPGAAAGLVVGGNLSLLAAAAAARPLPIPDGAMWLIEDVTERPYRIDRMLTALLPYLQRAAAVVFGDFDKCEPGPDGVTVEQVLRDRTAAWTAPTMMGAPFGHGATNRPFHIGRSATLQGDALHFH
jgi:muramoyltetrapeptide carboxypeptidase